MNSKTGLRQNGQHLLSQILGARDTTDPDVQTCRLGLNNNNETIALFNGVKSSFVAAYSSTLGSKRRRRSSSTLTCADINNLAGSLNTLSTTSLSNILNSEFSACLQILGSSTNNWSAAQLVVLATKIKSVNKISKLIKIRQIFEAFFVI